MTLRLSKGNARSHRIELQPILDKHGPSLDIIVTSIICPCVDSHGVRQSRRRRFQSKTQPPFYELKTGRYVTSPGDQTAICYFLSWENRGIIQGTESFAARVVSGCWRAGRWPSGSLVTCSGRGKKPFMGGSRGVS